MSWPFVTFGIPDEEFLRVEDVPMTKEEIRVLVISKLRLRRGNRVMDVGCGTGSVAVEMALAVGPEGRVYAVDRDPKAVELTTRNLERFGVTDRVQVISGDALEVLKGFNEELDGAFIGGGSDELEEIIRSLDKMLRRGARIVGDAIQLETANKLVKSLESLGYKVEVELISISKGRRTSTGYAMIARNPIFIIVGEKK
ncbi:MAG: precorrin-6Y C5,15-methyltransferase (decarboxylating) subunit CbiT [Metallosphaera yellowstonensis]|uniref:Probable cobalt-precorrin-6B C(15)-methyltransferase (decarboxylating) n=1 Tax=Metallosphaera yellowstonensis MK1 TaxID=671065 RepID=H2C634_9CREN|nr:precorrin-6Y C5,15-methyltransferase (decarboxylating) subunit CbiT [Metallosphaera yellowstonensis]EHP69261.1 precorrin-6Y C5,15-methyltransferase (decarboxylating), CbiT subunit [Metallosphaera yellowstonensis MK1]